VDVVYNAATRIRADAHEELRRPDRRRPSKQFYAQHYGVGETGRRPRPPKSPTVLLRAQVSATMIKAGWRSWRTSSSPGCLLLSRPPGQAARERLRPSRARARVLREEDAEEEQAPGKRCPLDHHPPCDSLSFITRRRGQPASQPASQTAQSARPSQRSCTHPVAWPGWLPSGFHSLIKRLQNTAM
jgi:hypothetical protein